MAVIVSGGSWLGLLDRQLAVLDFNDLMNKTGKGVWWGGIGK